MEFKSINSIIAPTSGISWAGKTLLQLLLVPPSYSWQADWGYCVEDHNLEQTTLSLMMEMMILLIATPRTTFTSASTYGPCAVFKYLWALSHLILKKSSKVCAKWVSWCTFFTQETWGFGRIRNVDLRAQALSQQENLHFRSCGLDQLCWCSQHRVEALKHTSSHKGPLFPTEGSE